MRIPTDKKIYEFCKDHYYCNEVGGERPKWQPFENWSDEAIEEQIDTDVIVLKRFLNNKYKK